MSTTKRSKLTLVETYGHGGKKSNSHVLKDIEPIQRLESQAWIQKVGHSVTQHQSIFYGLHAGGAVEIDCWLDQQGALRFQYSFHEAPTGNNGKPTLEQSKLLTYEELQKAELEYGVGRELPLKLLAQIAMLNWARANEQAPVEKPKSYYILGLRTSRRGELRFFTKYSAKSKHADTAGNLISPNVRVFNSKRKALEMAEKLYAISKYTNPSQTAYKPIIFDLKNLETDTLPNLTWTYRNKSPKDKNSK